MALSRLRDTEGGDGGVPMNAPAPHKLDRLPSRHWNEQLPKAYLTIPTRLLADLHDTPLAIGLYALIGRLYLVHQAPVPLSRADVLRYDPTLKAGAVKRAFDRLVAGGWLVEAIPEGRKKQRYTPTWGRVQGSPLPSVAGGTPVIGDHLAAPTHPRRRSRRRPRYGADRQRYAAARPGPPAAVSFDGRPRPAAFFCAARLDRVLDRSLDRFSDRSCRRSRRRANRASIG